MIHENITLMVQGAHLTADFNAKNLFQILYTQQKVKCSLTQCESCAGSDAVHKLLSKMENF
jgi:hypothetical protein